MGPFYSSLCSEVGRAVDTSLQGQLERDNKEKLQQLEEAITDAEENLGDLEHKDALMAKAEYLSRIGDKVAKQTVGWTVDPALFSYKKMEYLHKRILCTCEAVSNLNYASL